MLATSPWCKDRYMTRPLEISWFSALCDDDAEQLGVADPALRSSFEHCAAIVVEAERQGFDAILLPSGYELGIDNTVFAAAVAGRTHRIRLLLAVRTGELWPAQLGRQVASLDEIAGGRIDLNLISSALPGEILAADARYARTARVMGDLDDLLSGRPAGTLGPPRIARDRHRRPPFYFGGLSEPARDVAARCADVYLMWPDTLEGVAATIADMRRRAEVMGRTLRFGYRVHVVVRETEREAREAAAHLVAALDPELGDALRAKALDSGSVGVAAQATLRDIADAEGYVDRHLFTGIGRARSGCGAAIVGDPDQVAGYLRELQDLGIEAVILSGYPHREECRRAGELLLPLLEHGPLFRGA